MHIPTEIECFELMKRHQMRENIVRHSVQVMKVSMALYENLRDPSSIRPELIHAGALLHDIAKTRAIETKELRHDLLGAEMMRELGYEGIAQIVESHVVFNDFKPDGELEEREIVFYADKRVMHDQIVSLDDRIRDLVKRYGVNERVVHLIRDNKGLIVRIERKIQSFLTRDIEEILSKVADPQPQDDDDDDEI
jgi:putative nucleotidyltransferase with HDIG domain